MAKRSGMYKHDKRQKELKRKKKQEEKRLKRQKESEAASQDPELPDNTVSDLNPEPSGAE